jgi:hypothetical protein
MESTKNISPFCCPLREEKKKKELREKKRESMRIEKRVDERRKENR